MTDQQLPEPLVPVGSDLRNFPFTPIFRSRLFGSSFHARVTDSEWRSGVTLWLKSWDQVPAGSLPDDEIDLCRLAELGRDLKTWRKVRTGALRGWFKCSDGRLYHPVVAEGINDALTGKTEQRQRTTKARIAALRKRLESISDSDQRQSVTEEIDRLLLSLESNHPPPVTGPVTDPVTESNRKGDRQGQGNGEGNGKGQEKGKLTPKARFAAPEWVPPEPWAAFEAMRNRIRKPMTDRAKELVIIELDKLRGQGHDPAGVLEQSVRKSWQDVYALDQRAAGASKGQADVSDRNRQRTADWQPPETGEVHS